MTRIFFLLSRKDINVTSLIQNNKIRYSDQKRREKRRERAK